MNEAARHTPSPRPFHRRASVLGNSGSFTFERPADDPALATRMVEVGDRLRVAAADKGILLTEAELGRAMAVMRGEMARMTAGGMAQFANDATMIARGLDVALGSMTAMDLQARQRQDAKAVAEALSAKGGSSEVTQLAKLQMVREMGTSNAPKTGYGALAAYGGDSLKAQRTQVEGWANDFKVPWLVNLSGYEKLSRQDVQAIAESGLKRAGAKALERAGEFKGKDIANFARQAIATGQDAEEMAKSYAKNLEAISDPKLRKECADSDKAVLDVLHNDKLGDDRKQTELRRLGQQRDDLRGRMKPEDRRHMDHNEKDVLKIKEKLDAATATTGSKNANADARTDNASVKEANADAASTHEGNSFRSLMALRANAGPKSEAKTQANEPAQSTESAPGPTPPSSRPSAQTPTKGLTP